MKRSIVLGVLIGSLIISLLAGALAEGKYLSETPEVIITVAAIKIPAGDPDDYEDDEVIYDLKEGEVEITITDEMSEQDIAICTDVESKKELLANVKNLPNVVKEVTKSKKQAYDYEDWINFGAKVSGEALEIMKANKEAYIDYNVLVVGEDAYDDELIVIRYDYDTNNWSALDPKAVRVQGDGSVTIALNEENSIVGFIEPTSILVSHSATYNAMPDLEYVNVMQHIVENETDYTEDDSVYDITGEDIFATPADAFTGDAREAYMFFAKKRTLEGIADNLNDVIEKVAPGKKADDFAIRDVLSVDVIGGTLDALVVNEYRYVNVNFDFFNKYNNDDPIITLKYNYDTKEVTALEPEMTVLEEDGSVTIRITDDRCFLAFMVLKEE